MKFLPITPQLATEDRIEDSELLADLCSACLSMYPGGIPQSPWLGYLVEEAGEIIGTCAFKTPPVSGSVEIAYFTFPGQEGRGIATRMAAWLIELAAQHGVTLVTAQTLPEKSASTSILEKLGFRLTGPVNHPEDGVVWQWQLATSVTR